MGIILTAPPESSWNHLDFPQINISVHNPDVWSHLRYLLSINSSSIWFTVLAGTDWHYRAKWFDILHLASFGTFLLIRPVSSPTEGTELSGSLLKNIQFSIGFSVRKFCMRTSVTASLRQILNTVSSWADDISGVFLSFVCHLYQG